MIILRGTRTNIYRNLRSAKILYNASFHTELFENVDTYCMFIGYPRSGHSLVGSLIDAHPDAIVALGVNALERVNAGVSRPQLYWLLLEGSRRAAQLGRKGGGGYSYQVPNQWQGRFRRLRVIGDKKGDKSSSLLYSQPALLDSLRQTVGVKIRILHVIRNPYDNISTMSKRSGQSLPMCMDRYFSLVDSASYIKAQVLPRELMDLRHERIIEDPVSSLKDICEFLGLEADGTYLNDCAKIVYESPYKSRYDAQWEPAMLTRVQDKIDGCSFLEGYSYTE